MKTQQPINKFFYTLAMATIFMATASILLVTYWLIYPYNILQFKENNGTLLTTKVVNGGYLEMYQNYCKNMDIVSTVTRQFIDGIIYQAPIMYNNRPTGCHEFIEKIYVPKTLNTGKYQSISTVISFKPNPIRTVTFTVKTGPFEIVEATSSAK